MNLSDQTQRERFFVELEQNFSVIAPAGVGKTSAIVRRILQMAQSDLHKGTNYLKNLVVVTYGQKAAEEMAERTRNALSEEFPKYIFPHFPNFSTIHSLCLQLLQSYGPWLGFPSTLKLIEDDTDLWDEFLITAPIFSQEVFLEQWKMIKRYLPLSLLLKGARKWSSAEINKKPVFFTKNQKIPSPELSPLLNFQANSKNKQEVEKAKRLLKLWQENESNYNPLPKFEKGGKDFQLLWQKTFFPTQTAIEEQALSLIQVLAQAYQNFRLEQSYVTYDDMISLANQLLINSTNREIDIPSYRILLDEAQDTDPLQFEVLLRLAQKQSSKPKDLIDLVQQIPSGNFCMVGDPQQSIFESRADLKTYLNIHHAMKTRDQQSELRFEVTLRCDQAITDEVNRNFYEKFPQVFFPLKARPEAILGEVEEWSIKLPANELENSAQKADHEAHQLALNLSQIASELENDLSHIAILAPRNQWLESVKKALDAHQIPCQLHSSQQIQGAKIPYAWFSALIHLLCYPEDSFELSGVLREVYGIEDQELLHFREQSKLLKLQEFPSASFSIEVIINELYHLQQKCLRLPLRSAVEMLVHSTHLEERLKAIQYPNTEKELFYWKSLSNNYENLYAFESFLRQQRLKPVGTDNKLTNHIQLYSCHKSKGLEWSTVILPFFYRKIEFHRENYPCLYKTTQGTPRVLLNKASERTFSSDERNNELQRLAYVSFTRARHRLILINDRQLWKETKGSFAQLINFDSTKRTSPQRMHSFHCIRKNSPKPPQKTTISSSPSVQEILSKTSKASHIARQIPFKINPSSWQSPSEAISTA